MAGHEAFRSIPNKDSHLPWWKNDGLFRLNLLLCCIFLTQYLNGYDANLVGGFQAMSAWKTSLGYPDSSKIGLLNTAPYLVGLVTAPFAAWIADKWGRKWCIQYASVTNLVGTAIGCAAGAGGSSTDGYAMFMVSRIIIGSGLAFSLMCSPIMLQELPHPKHRTWMAGFFDVAFICGNFTAAWLGCSHLTNNWSWSALSILIHIGPALVSIFVITYVPESPRWLIKKGRDNEAKAFFAKYHANGAEDDELAAFEYAEVHEAIRMETETKQDSWKVIFSSRSNRHRLGCVILIATCQNLSGTGNISYFRFPLVLKIVGITNTVTLTGLNAGSTSFSFVMAMFGLWLTQRINRRPQLLGAWLAVLLANIGLTTCLAMYTKTGNKGASIAAVAFMWLYNGAFFVACGSIFFSYPAEVLHYSMRGKGMMIWTITAKCLGVFSSYTNPVA
ncbi:general substrate transporter, partial [Hymenopellis radicata]